MTTTNLVTKLINEINGWNKENIADLQETMSLLRDMREDADLLVDMSDLPSEPIPSGRESYPIWAMDKMGFCLVGDDASSIEHISSIIEE